MNPDEDDDRTVIRPPSARARDATASTSPPGTVDAILPTMATVATIATVPSMPSTGMPTMAQTTQHTLTLPAGIRIAEFEVTSTIGEGGFGIVYLAWDHSLQRKVALKEYMPSSIATRLGQTDIKPRSERHQETFDAGLKSFINEARLLAQFDHASLLKVYRFWEANGTAYMVMPFLEGATLRDTVRGFAEPPGEAWIVALLAPLFDALAMLHAAQCYHRDIAPDNILLLADGGRPLLLDFGAARRVIGEATQALTAILKPGYAPVEQYAEIPGLKQGPWTDIYALAAVVHWMVTGKTPSPSVGRLFDDSHVPLAQRAAGKYSPHFLEAVDRALAVMPDHRTQSVEAFRDELMGGAPPPVGPLQAFAPPTAGNAPRGAGGPATQVRRPTLPPRSGTDAHTTVRLEPASTVPAARAAGNARRIPWLPIVAVVVLVAAGAGYMFWPKPGTVVDTSSAIPAAPTTPPAASAAAVLPRTVEPTVVAPPVDQGAAASAAASAVIAQPTIETVPPITKSPVRVDPVKAATAQDKPAVRKPAAPRPERNDDAATAEPKPTAGDNHAECAKLFQRLSLGDTDPTLTDRVRALRCR